MVRIYFLLIIFFIVSCNRQDIDKNKKNINPNGKILNRTITTQKITTRQWKNFQFSSVADKNLDSLYNGIHLEVDNNQKLYIYDLPMQTIKEYDNNFNFIKHYGNGKGYGPREFSNITGYSITNEKLYVCDPQLGKISVFSKNGKFIKAYALEKRPYRIITLKNGFTAVKSTGINKKIFDLYDLKFNKIDSFGDTLSMTSIERAILADGQICTDGNFRIFYGMRYIGLLFSYDIQTKIGYYIKTIDATSKPKLDIIAHGKGVRAPRKKPFSCLSISYSKGNLYILSYAGDGVFGKSPVMDVYNPDSGLYLYSFKLPIKTGNAVVKDGIIYTLIDHLRLKAWAIDKIQAVNHS